MLNKQFHDIIKWQAETFPQATTLSKIAHLKEELEELIIDIKNNHPNKEMEFADCFILLYGAAAVSGMSYHDILCAINKKMHINYQREWGEPNKDGVVNHKK